MTYQHAKWRVALGLLAAALWAAGCQDAPDPVASAQPRLPRFWFGGDHCTPTKFTGGGRIDPPNQDAVDQATPLSGPQLTGKLTFGFNVFLGTDDNGNCVVTKGEIQAVYHPSQTAWHVSIHDGVNSIGGSEVAALVYADPSGGACVVVGVDYTSARVDGQQGTDQVRMTACDNDRGQPQSSGKDAFRWESSSDGDTQLTYLTGGNIVAH